MDIEALQNAISSGMNTTLEKCYIPSLDKKYSFSSVTVSEIKNISKVLINSQEDPLTVFETLCALIQSKCIEDIDITKLNEFDRIKILYFIFNQNKMIEDVEVNCNNCGKKSVISQDRETVLKKMDEIKFEETIWENGQSNSLRCVINIPKIEYMYHYYHLVSNNAIDDKERFYSLLKLFISEINLSFENESVEDIKILLDDEIKEENLKQYLEVIETLPANLLNKENGEKLFDYISEIVNRMYEPQNVSLNCTHCGHRLGGEATALNFI